MLSGSLGSAGIPLNASGLTGYRAPKKEHQHTTTTSNARTNITATATATATASAESSSTTSGNGGGVNDSTKGSGEKDDHSVAVGNGDSTANSAHVPEDSHSGKSAVLGDDDDYGGDYEEEFDEEDAEMAKKFIPVVNQNVTDDD
jgi:hypothetical protein